MSCRYGVMENLPQTCNWCVMANGRGLRGCRHVAAARCELQRARIAGPAHHPHRRFVGSETAAFGGPKRKAAAMVRGSAVLAPGVHMAQGMRGPADAQCVGLCYGYAGDGMELIILL